MSYVRIDPQIQNWAERHYLKLFTSFAGREARFVYVSSVAGECFQIWIEPPLSGKINLHAACIEGRTDTNPPRDWCVDEAELPSALHEAFQKVLDWMKPSDRYWPDRAKGSTEIERRK